MLNPAISPETVPASLLGLWDPVTGPSDCYAGCMRRASSLGEMTSPPGTGGVGPTSSRRGGGPSVWASSWRSEGPGSSCPSSSAISVSVDSSSGSSGEVSSWRASSSCVQQSLRRSSYVVLALSMALRVVLRVVSLTSVSRPLGVSAAISRATVVTSISQHSVAHLWLQ